MLTAIATLIFLAAAWLAIQSVAGTLDGRTAKISAALGGEVTQPTPINEWSTRLPRSARQDEAPLRAAA